MKIQFQQIHFIHITVILLLFLISFNSCILGNGGYEGIEAATRRGDFAFKHNTVKMIDNGYYHLEATDSLNHNSIIMIFPSGKGEFVYTIPFDGMTSIRIMMEDSHKTYSCSSSEGEGEIYVETHPDSLFSELSGTFNCRMVNVSESSDTLYVNSGTFRFVF
ncbi:MAG: hypothetical protein R6U31_02830 [bacterium]